MNNSRNKYMRKMNFPKRLCFLPVKSQIRKLSKIVKNAVSWKSAKSGPTSKSCKSWIMVVRGRYMTHFDRRDLLKSKKTGLGGFRNLSDLQRSIHQFLRFFREISDITRNLKKSSASTFEFEIFFQKFIFMQKNLNPWKLNTLAPFWYIYFGLTPIMSKDTVFWNHNDHISQAIGNSLLWHPLIWSKKNCFIFHYTGPP